MNTPDPTPVPSVRKMTFPGLPLPTPKRISAIPAASASLMIEDRPLEDLRQPLDDREVDPGLVDVAGELEHAVEGDAGQPDADRRSIRRGPPDLTSRLTSRAIEAMTASGVDGTGVGTRSRSETSGVRSRRRRRPP